MERKDILQNLGDLLFDDIFINEKAVELQAKDPEAFRMLIHELIEREDFSEETFYELYEQYEDNDKIDYITQYQYLASKTIISDKDEDGCIFDGPEYEETIFGFELDDYPTSMNYKKTYFEIDLDNIDDELDKDDLTIEEKDILDILDAYKSNIDGTCLFAVLELITKNPDLIDMIPNTHAAILGLDDLMNSAHINKSSSYQLINLLESIPGAYLTYSSYHNLQIDDMDELVEKVNDNINKFMVEEIYKFPIKR